MGDLLYEVLIVIYNIANTEIKFSLSLFIPFLIFWSWLTLKLFRKEWMGVEIKKARKKPVEIEFMQFNNIENAYDISQWAVGKIKYKVSRKFDIGYMYVETLEGIMTASLGDYIVKGVNGEFYPVKPEIFEKTYEVLGKWELHSAV